MLPDSRLDSPSNLLKFCVLEVGDVIRPDPHAVSHLKWIYLKYSKNATTFSRAIICDLSLSSRSSTSLSKYLYLPGFSTWIWIYILSLDLRTLQLSFDYFANAGILLLIYQNSPRPSAGWWGLKRWPLMTSLSNPTPQGGPGAAPALSNTQIQTYTSLSSDETLTTRSWKLFYTRPSHCNSWYCLWQACWRTWVTT